MSYTPTYQQIQILDKLKPFGFGEWSAWRGLEQDFRCIYCDRDLLASYNDYDSWQFDHIEPQSNTGKHEYENIAVCCKACNFLKRADVPKGNTREEQIADARRIIRERRLKQEVILAEIRHLVRPDNSTPGERNSKPLTA